MNQKKVTSKSDNQKEKTFGNNRKQMAAIQEGVNIQYNG